MAPRFHIAMAACLLLMAAADPPALRGAHVSQDGSPDWWMSEFEDEESGGNADERLLSDEYDPLYPNYTDTDGGSPAPPPPSPSPAPDPCGNGRRLNDGEACQLNDVDTITCRFTVDDVLWRIFYNEVDITYRVDGNHFNWQEVKTVSFDYVEGGILKIRTKNNQVGNQCETGGLILICKDAKGNVRLESNTRNWEAMAAVMEIGNVQYETARLSVSPFDMPNKGNALPICSVFYSDYDMWTIFKVVVPGQGQWESQILVDEPEEENILMYALGNTMQGIEDRLDKVEEMFGKIPLPDLPFFR